MSFQFRKVERKTETGWEGIEFKELIPGDVFKLYDPDNSLEDGSKEYIASSDVFAVAPEGNYGVEIKEVQ